MTATARTRRFGVDTMLPHAWALRTDQPDGVKDVEAFSQEIVEKARRSQGMPMLEPCDLAEAIGFCLGQVVVLDRQFDVAKQRKPYLRFDLWLRTALYCDVIDFWRSPAGFGRHGQHRTPATGEQSLDDAAREHDGDSSFDGRRAHPDRLDPATSLDPADSLDARRWLDATADRSEVGPVGGSCGAAGAVAQGFDRGAGDRADRQALPGVAGARVVVAFVDCECGWRSYRQAPNGVGRWHLPDFCAGCGRALLELVESVSSGSGGLEERPERAAA